MIGLDTNIIVRYLTQDDPIQSRKATEIIERRLSEENPGFVSIVAMVETVWVLERAYSVAAHEIAAAVERMLQIDVLIVENEQEVFTAMIALNQGRGSFADALIAEGKLQADVAKALGVSVMTYHRWRKARKSSRPAMPVRSIETAGDASPIEQTRRINQLQLENARLRRLVTDLLLEKMNLA